jgi:hypothetical protein
MSKILAYCAVTSSCLEFCCKGCGRPFSPPREKSDAEVFNCPNCGDEFPAGADSIHDQVKRLKEYAERTIIPQYKITEFIEQWEVVSITVPLYDRVGYRQVANDLYNGDHITFADLRLAFLNSSDFIETAARFIRCGKHIHDASTGLVLSPHEQVDVSKLFEVLGHLQADAVRSAHNKRLKDEARKNGRMLNGTAVYGFKIIRDDKSRPYLVPDWKERKLMSELIRWRDEGVTWKECVTQCRVRKFKNSRADDGIYRDRTIRRMYESAKAADFAFSEG